MLLRLCSLSAWIFVLMAVSVEATDRITAPGTTIKDCHVCPELVIVAAGKFIMGSKNGQADQTPVRKVTLSARLAVGKFEVTFAEWDACVAASGCQHKPGDQGWGRGRRPVINVSWKVITEQYLPWLSRKTGKTYRLLSEAEWEYVARGGAATAFSWGNDIDCTKANYDGGQGSDCPNNPFAEHRGTVEVGTFAANGFGLFDVHGNVFEWVRDCYQDSYRGAPTDGSAVSADNCQMRVLRGGSWGVNKPNFLRVAYRLWLHPNLGQQFHGFRVARTLAP